MVLTKNTQNMLIIWMISCITLGANFVYTMTAELKTYLELGLVVIFTLIVIAIYVLSTDIMFKELGKYEKVKQDDEVLQSEQTLKQD